jgi:AcrR family transcriptional regulator
MCLKKEEKENLDVKQRILDTAGYLVMQKGVKETSLKDIAQEVGISKGTLYYYYSAKEDIIYDIADTHLQRITDELLLWINNIDRKTAPDEVIKTVFERIIAAETRGKLNIYLIGSAITNNDSLRERFKARYDEWRRTIEYGIGKVLGDEENDNKVLSFLILAALDGLIIQKLLGEQNIPVDEVAQLIARLGK